jgi:outer membrane protein OmpA-like peptidoglycan-associated protein
MKTERRGLTVTLVTGLALMVSGAVACGKNDRPAQDASTTPAPVTATEASAGDVREREVSVQISKPLRERCNLPDTPQDTPRFEYDQSTLRASGRNVLDDVATCLKDGPLKGEAITLVGRADPRGTAEYNQDLAESRAAAARNYLAQKGVPNEQMKLMALDRRVDIELGDLSNSPVLQGTMLQTESAKKPDNSPEAQKAGTYADVNEGSPPSTGASAK